MKTGKFILSFIVAALFASTLGLYFGAAVGVGSFALSLIPKVSQGALLTSVTPEIWTDYIIGNLFKDNEFLLQSVDESQYVIGTGVVHIPQAGNPSGVQRNRKVLPATITRRKDIDVTYVLDEFTTDPRFIPNIDKAELSYDKMDSCMNEDMMFLKQLIAESMLYNWKPKHFLKTTGDATVAHYGTGNRRAIKLVDFITAKETLNKWGIPKADRICIIDTTMKGQLVRELMASTTKDYSVIYNPITGEIDKLEGFQIFERSNVLLASNQTLTAETNSNYFSWTSTDLIYTPEEIVDIEAGTSAVATTAASVALFYQKSMVARAVGTTQMFDDQGNPQYYGDIYSFLQRAGGRGRRGDGKGVLGMIQVTV